MKKFFMLIICMNIIYFSAYTQGKYKLSGVIVDENKTALTGASVYLFPLKKGTVTNTQGEYSIAGLEKGKYLIEIAFIGYKTISDTLFISENMDYNAALSLAPLSLQEISITSNYAETRKNEESLNIEIVNDVFLKQHLGGSLMGSIERLPGVTSIYIGSGQSKPVIRGLGFNRVVVVENGIKHAGQEWGADHGLEIDQYAT
jgi:iron complex outermembrane receptor protein